MEIELSCNIFRVLEINEVQSFITIQFELALKWKDSRLDFSNLKMNPNLNLLNSEEKESIWSPKLVFYNTNEQKETQNDEKSYMVVNREGKYKSLEVIL